MRLLVVDDEKVVLNSIALIIKKEKLSFVEMETASTGKEAIEKAAVFHPDAVFMDINMPGLNGIEAMKSISKIYPSVLFVVITAYDVFEYAKESLKAGAFDYIVKPFLPKRIVEVLVSLNERIISRHEEREELIRLRERVAELSAFADDGALQLMINSREAEAFLNRYNKILPSGSGRIALLRTEERQIKRAEAALIEIKNGFEGVICGSIVSGRAVLFVPSNIEREKIENKLVKVIGENGFSLAWGSEEAVGNMRLSYANALNRADKKAESEKQAEREKQAPSAELYGKYESIAACASEELQYAAEELIYEISRGCEFRECVNRTAVAILVIAQLIIGGEAVDSRVAEAEGAGLKAMLNAADEKELADAAADFLIGLRGGISEGEGGIKKTITDYIDENYANDDISIESAAKYISVSVSTLSRLLRTELRKSFTELLIEKRISTACSMIKEGKYSIKEISYKVGYNDPNYFSRVFKKTTGLSPSDYREYGI